MLLLSKVQRMENNGHTDIRVPKHPRWSPSPVDLSLSTAFTPSHLQGKIAFISYFSKFAASSAPMSPGAYSLLANSPLNNGTPTLFSSRKQREFIPDSKKDDSYWDRRRRNNEAAKR
ncbi:uncharacterized protein B4U80_01640 [Leptotrombidium deliense]|uniref:Uncharacterized protein n=1 Tax=Leptotrombidium deliense TaxID=299467 RepID=A0A443SB62_9ACAR|nr:uncharacterized protein B4U80_01640 [Leptotrombidium deliense]